MRIFFWSLVLFIISVVGFLGYSWQMAEIKLGEARAAARVVREEMAEFRSSFSGNCFELEIEYNPPGTSELHWFNIRSGELNGYGTYDIEERRIVK